MRHCLGQQPFKYFVETDPTVPQWVKKITLADIQNWNTVLNKQDILEAGQHIIIDGNVISFDHTIDELATDFQYFKIGDERIYNDLRNYFITLNEEEFIPIDIMSNTAYMQWQDGIYTLDEDFDLDKVYKVVNDNVEYDVYTYWYRATLDPQVFIDIIRGTGNDYIFGYKKDNTENHIFVKRQNNVDTLVDGNDQELDDSAIEELFETKEFFLFDGEETYTTIYVLSDYDIRHPELVDLNIVLKTKDYIKVQPTDEFDSSETYYVYNRNTDTYSQETLNENTFKQRQNGLYIRSSMWNPDTLLTSKNIDQLLYDLADTAFGKAHERAYSNFVTYELKNYVTGRISALHIEGYLPKITFTNKMTDIENTLKNLQGVVNETNISIGGKQDTLSVIGDGLVFKSPHDYDGSQQDTTNKILSLGLDIWDDAHSNEYYKDEYRTERGYNGDDFGNLVHFHYKDTDNKIYLAVPFSKRLMYEDVAISSKAILNELNLNYEMKLATLDSNINFVDLDYYKNKWGVTGDNFTKDDYKTLLKEWYSIELDANDPNNQTLVNLYSYDGHNDKYYGRQRAIVINLSTENEIYTAVEWIAIEKHSESDFNSRTESWWYSDTIDGVKNFLSLGTWDEDEQKFVGGDTYPGDYKCYWTHGDSSAKTKIPSVDAVAKYAARGLSITQGLTSNTFDINLLNYAETILDTINANLNFDSTNRKVQIKSGNTLLSEVQLTDWVTKDTEQTITGKKTFNSDIYVKNNKGLKYSITGGGVTVERYMIAKDNVERVIVGNSSDALQFQSNNRPTYNNTQIALSNDFVNEETTFSGSVVGNKIYNLSTAISSLTVTSIENSKFESNIFFTTASTISSPFLTLPANTKIIGEEPDWEADKSYVMSVLKGVVVFGEIETYST